TTSRTVPCAACPTRCSSTSTRTARRACRAVRSRSGDAERLQARVVGRDLERAEARLRFDGIAAGRRTAGTGTSGARWPAAQQAAARRRRRRSSARRSQPRAAHPHLDLAAERVPVVPHDLARGCDLEEATVAARADEGVAVRQALAPGDEERE